MKILSITLENINSLAGRWHIPLDASAYTKARLFAITGETGAGKTSILDSICFALYGRTPRQGSINKSQGNEVMTKGAVFCMAEVRFEAEGILYRAKSSQRRARNKIDGNLQDVEREIVYDETGGIISNRNGATRSKKSQDSLQDLPVDEVVARITGLDYNQFTKSVLLAQGSFAAFLEGSTEERASILEKLSGTEVYTQIAIAAGERQKNARTQAQIYKARIDQIHPMTNEEVESIQEEKACIENQIQNAKTELEKLQKCEAWAQNLRLMQKQRDELLQCIEENEAAISRNKPLAEKLNRAREANDIKNYYEQLVQARKMHDEALNSVQNTSELLESLEKELQTVSQSFEIAQHKYNITIENYEREKPRLLEMRACDQELSITYEAYRERALVAQKAASDLNAITLEVQESQARLQEYQEKHSFLLKEHEEYKEDIHIPRIVAVFETYLKNLEERRQAIQKLEDTINTKQKILSAIVKEIDTAHNHLMDSQKKQRLANDECERIIQELELLIDGNSVEYYKKRIRQYQETMDAYRKINKFEAERVFLQKQDDSEHNGLPCPLCGSKHHPGFEDAINERQAKIQELCSLYQNDENRIENIEILESKKLKCQAICIQFDSNVTNYNAEYQILCHKLKDIEDSISNLNTELQKNKMGYKDSLDQLNQSIKFYNFNIQPDLKNAYAVLQRLNQRANNYELREQNIKSLEDSIYQFNLTLIANQATCTQKQQIVQEYESEAKTKFKIYEQKKQQRILKFGNTTPESLESKLNQEITESQKYKEETLKNKQNLEKIRSGALQRCDAQRETLALRKQESQKASQVFFEKLHPSCFSTELELKDAFLAHEEFEKLEECQLKLNAQKQDLDSKWMQKKDELQALTAQNLTDEPLESILLQIQETKDQSEALIKRSGELQQSLLAFKKQQIIFQDLSIQLQKALEEQDRWDKLMDCLGTTTGTTYRKFVQSLTFCQLLGFANEALRQFTTRYILVQNNDTAEFLDKKEIENNLRFFVIDNEQGALIRPTSNLSGGEKFLISLALALGLSHMASRKIRLDTLFLDEGFGSLDEDALDRVLAALTTVAQKSNKTIGIISHVETLKNTIQTQIAVKRGVGGHSFLSGPGITRAELKKES